MISDTDGRKTGTRKHDKLPKHSVKQVHTPGARTDLASNNKQVLVSDFRTADGLTRVSTSESDSKGGIVSPVERELSGNVLHLKINREAKVLEEGDALASTGHSARTIAKQGSLRLTLIAVAAGGHVRTHRAGSPVSVQVLKGNARMHVEGRDYHLETGDLLVLGADIEHDVSSEGGGLLLLSVAQNTAQGA